MDGEIDNDSYAKRCITRRDEVFKEDIMFMFDKPIETYDHKPNEIEVDHPPNHESNELPSTTLEETRSSSFLQPT